MSGNEKAQELATILLMSSNEKLKEMAKMWVVDMERQELTVDDILDNLANYLES